MAKNKSTVYLGYEDEEITVKHAQLLLDSTVNKIGGVADWPDGDIKVPTCPSCSAVRPLIVQLYAPLEQSQFHRTLYIFACLNPACSSYSKNWVCIRTQHLDTPNQAEIISAVTSSINNKKKKSTKQMLATPVQQKISWCNGVDDWGDTVDACDDMDTTADDYQQQNEENGNVIEKIDNSPARYLVSGGANLSLVGSEEEYDDEDESNSMENDLICGFGQIDMHSPQNANDDPNANCAAGIQADAAGGFVGGYGATAAICAEIEGAETDVVLVETPKKPERDLIALLKHTPSSAAIGPLSKITDLTIKPYFISVEMENRHRHNDYEYYGGSLSADHIRELYQEYKRLDESAHSPNGAVGGIHTSSASAAVNVAGGGGAAAAAAVGGEEQESYEKSLPAHGDLIFHQFVSTLQQNPGQILRYSRDTLPLLIAPLTESVPKCPNCNGETICEVQILSTLIPKLKLQYNNENAPIEYGNVLVFTCLKSCWDTPDKMRFERIIVQAEI